MIKINFSGPGDVRFGVQLSRPEAEALNEYLNAALAAAVLQPPSTIIVDRMSPAAAALAVDRATRRRSA